jgi:hypothetical protein
MGKCPAPCDGSVSMQQYRLLIEWSVATLIDPTTEIEQQEQRMREASAELRFELAGRIKQFVDNLAELRKNEWKFVRPLEDFRYLALQPGPGKGQVKLFTCTAERTECVACVRGEPRELMLRIEALQKLTHSQPRMTKFDTHRFGIVARHLMTAKSGGVFLHGDDLTDRAIAAACKQLSKQSTPVVETEDEGLVASIAQS